ncbi:SixA phosphatase family protein [Azospirillum canadense]|uniref:SixA phosphatase family protein n=1 Tax=Azospirillum canadense TaxID=403962 RepID=UPI0022266973|nr:histidine phosphatase family protein [Azospirillum canadense]MCW2243655.1 phosphohistidine phosphatase [Azospirillum canadense]
MKTLYLLRHGKSAWDDPDLDDHDRPLAPRGQKASRRVGAYLKERKAHFDLALCSTAARAEDTLRRVLAAMDLPNLPVEYERGLYLCGARVLLERLRDAPESAASLMLVAHNPDLHDLARELTGSGDDGHRRALEEKFPTGACAVLLFETVHWRDLDLGAGRLADFILPRKLS